MLRFLRRAQPEESGIEVPPMFRGSPHPPGNARESIQMDRARNAGIALPAGREPGGSRASDSALASFHPPRCGDDIAGVAVEVIAMAIQAVAGPE